MSNIGDRGAVTFGDIVAQRVSARLYGSVDAETDLDNISATNRADGMLAVVLTDWSVWVFDLDSTATEVTGSVRTPAAGDGRWIRTGATLSETTARIGASVADTTALQAITAANRSNGQLVVKRDTDTIFTFDSGSSAGASDWVIVPAAGTGRWLRNHVSLADLAAVTNAHGAALVGVEDTGGYFSATTVEGALQEVRADLAAVTNGNGASMVGIEDVATIYTATTVEAALAEVKVLVDAGMTVLKKTLTADHTTITAAAATEALNIGTALPANSRIVGVDMHTLTPFSGGTVGDFTVDIGTAGDVDALIDGADLFTAAVDGGPATMPQGVRPNKFFAAGGQLIATFRCGSDDVGDATAGAVTIDVLHVVLA